jgi:hypothetical protein
MHDDIHGAGDEDEVGDIMLDEVEILTSREMGDVVHTPGDQIVHNDKLVSLSEKSITQMGADETCPSCDEYAQANLLRV